MPRKYKTKKKRIFKKRKYMGTRSVNIGPDAWSRRVNMMGVHYFKRTFSIPESLVRKDAQGNGCALSYDSANEAWVLGTGNGNTSNVSYFSMGIKFDLDNLPGLADFTSLFDSYKLSAVKIKIIPFGTSANMQGGQSTTDSNQALSSMNYSVIDYDDYDYFSASTAGIQGMQQYTSIKVRNPYAYNGKPITRYFVPRLAQPTYAGTLSTAYVSSKPRWIDCNNTKAEHYGFKTLWEVFSPKPDVQNYLWFKIEATLYMKFKGVR